MISSIKGKITDENNQPIPSATVFLSDEKGKLFNEKARVKADLDGNYSLPFSMPLPNPFTGKITSVPLAKYVTVKFTGYPDRTIPFPASFFNTSRSGVGTFDIPMFLREQTTAEVEVFANRSKFLCEKNGGTWDEATKTCKMPEPEKSWWSKHKWWVIGGLGLIATTTTIIVLRRKK
jgi:hypothetical protein